MSINSSYTAWYISTFGYESPQKADQADINGTRYWQIGVSVPIPNPHFRYPKKASYNIITDSTTGQVSVRIQFASASLRSLFENLMQENLYGLVSNNSTRQGEIVQLSGDFTEQSSYSIDIKFRNGLENAYTGNNSLLNIFFAKMAEKWECDSEELVPVNLRKVFPVEIENMIGSPFAQRLHMDSTSFISGKTQKFFTVIPNLQNYVPITEDKFKQTKQNYRYRIGARYCIKYNPQPAGDSTSYGLIRIVLPGCTSQNKVLLNYIEGTNELFYLFNSSSFNDWDTYPNIVDSTEKKKVVIQFTGDSTGRDLYFSIEDIYLEHSAGVETTLGCLLLTRVPNRDSIQMDNETFEENIQLSNADRFPYFPFGNPNRSGKLRLSCTFENSNMDTYYKLKILESFQSDGFNINLHTHLKEHPEVLIGRMKIGPYSKGIFDLNKVSFAFEFMEV